MKPFESMKLGDKPSADDEEPEGEGDEKPSFSDDGAQMATRSFIKALGIDPGNVDMGKATKALKAVVASCMDSGEDY